MDMLSSLKLGIKLLGFSEVEGRKSVRMYLFNAVYFVVVTNMAFFVVDNWNDIDNRINALRGIVFLTTYICYAWSYLVYWKDFSDMIQIFHEMHFKTPYAISEQRKRTMVSLEVYNEKVNKFWWALIGAYTASIALIPLITVIIKVVLLSMDFQQVIHEGLSIPFPLYYPEYIKHFENIEYEMNALVYVSGYILQTSLTAFTCLCAHLAHVTCLCSMANLQNELKLLRLSIMEMEEHVCQADVIPNDKELLDNYWIRFTKYFIRHHQDIYRKFNVINTGIKWHGASAKMAAALYICMSIYTIVQKDQMVSKAQEGINFAVWASAVFLLDYAGEKIKTEDEKLKDAFYECSWVDKPKCLKTALLLAMTRSCRPIDIKPFRLFTFSHNNFASTMNAAYSYYNLLRNFKNG